MPAYVGDTIGQASQLFNQDQQVRNASADEAFRQLLGQLNFRRQMAEQMATRDQNAGFTQEELNLRRGNALTQATQWETQNNQTKAYYDWLMKQPAKGQDVKDNNAAILGTYVGDDPTLNTINQQALLQQKHAQDLVDFGNASLNAALQPVAGSGFWSTLGRNINPLNWFNPNRQPDVSWARPGMPGQPPTTADRVNGWSRAAALAAQGKDPLISQDPTGRYFSNLPMLAGGVGVVPAMQPATAGVPAVQLGQIQVPNVSYDIVGNRGNLNGVIPQDATSIAVPPLGQRTVGQTYTLPKGKFTWTTAGWIPAAM